jgi:hypothetical protein
VAVYGARRSGKAFFLPLLTARTPSGAESATCAVDDDAVSIPRLRPLLGVSRGTLRILTAFPPLSGSLSCGEKLALCSCGGQIVGPAGAKQADMMFEIEPLPGHRLEPSPPATIAIKTATLSHFRK